MRDVFICYAPLDVAIAENICGFLENEKISSWLALRDLAAGDDVAAMTETAIDACPVLVLILSHEANGSPEVQNQVERALQAEKILIPLRIENVTPTGRMEASLRHRFRHDAFVGPLERHLPELVRMLKPLLHRLVVKPRESTSITRTLPSRSSIVRGPDERKTDASYESKGPLQVAFHFPHPVFAGHASLVEVKVCAIDMARRGKAALTLEGLGLKRTVTLNLEKWADQPEQCHRISFDPARSGTFPLHVTVTLDDDTKRLKLTGVRSLRINAAHGMNDLVRAEDVMINHEIEDMFLAQPAYEEEAGSPLHELLAIELPENFETMELKLDFEVDRWAIESLTLSKPLEVPHELEDHGRPGTLLRLEPESASADLPFQEIRLVARPIFYVGRSREESDYMAWFWPRNDIHDTKTRRISKRHAAFVREGATIVIQNIATGSLTTFDGQDLAGSEMLILDGLGTLNLSGIYELGVARFPSTLGAPPSSPHADTPRGSVSLTSRTPNTLPQQVLWLLTDGSFGSSAANPLPLPIASLAEVQGRFHHDHGMFWIESVVDNGAVELEGVTLERGKMVPLGHGMKVRLGDQIFRVAVDV
jgi:hypothetical protein